MRLFRYLTFGLMGVLVLAGAARLRIAKITIKERSGPRTIFRVCLPGREPDVYAMTDRDFMCHLYDRYGFRHLGGFGLAAEGSTNRPPVLFPASAPAGEVDEAAAIAIARRAVATNDSWADRATYEANRDGPRWLVSAKRIEGYYDSGEPKFVWGGDRLIVIETNGAVTRYIRGR
jgi:hypothetical protein